MKIILLSIVVSALLRTTTASGSDQDSSRIVGGSPVKPGEFPYYVQLDRCGGTLIAPDVILTSAFCAGDHTIPSDALVGAVKRGTTKHGAVFREVVEWEIHPGWADATEFNFALGKLDSPVYLSTPIELWMNDQAATPFDNEDLIVMGMGVKNPFSTFYGNTGVNRLRYAEVPAMNMDQCNSTSQQVAGVIRETLVCTDPSDGESPCLGDQGSPLVKRVGNNHVQVGVVAEIFMCGQYAFPDFYGRVSYVYDWIKTTVCDTWNIVSNFCGGGQPASFCFDDPDFLFRGQPGKTCNWVLQRAPKRCKLKQNGLKLASYCPLSCFECLWR